MNRKDHAIQRAASASKRASGIKYISSSVRDCDEEWMRQIAIMPNDTRNLTGQLLGDPIPGDPRRPWLYGDTA